MKTSLVFLTLIAAAVARAQPAIDWLTLDAAGGAQSSVNYAANFTLGQSDVGAAESASANYRIIPGFWALDTFVPTGTRPELRITLNGPRVIFYWPSPSTGFVLEHTDSLDVLPASWSNTPGTVSDNGSLKSLTVPHDLARRFYRLRKN